MKKLMKFVLFSLLFLPLALPTNVSAASDDWKAQGSVGFFEFYDSTEAVNIVKDTASRFGQVKIGEKGDATSWDLFKSSLQYIVTCNTLRGWHGAQALRITDSMMAIAQVQVDVSASTLTHSNIYCANENLAWGFNIDQPFGNGKFQDNPFNSWYTDEREKYAQNPSNTYDTVHYRNIINTSWTVTGFAITTNSPKASNGNVFAQVFRTSDPSTSYSPEEYLERMESYEDAMELGITENQTGVPTYRLYNPNSGEHFYTQSASERKTLISAGWKSEQIGWYAPETSDKPVYRLYNPNAGDHHYTADYAEKQALEAQGWNYEGIGWYSADESGTPVWRQYNPNAVVGSHNFTTDKAEHEALGRNGWALEGIAWYGL